MLDSFLKRLFAGLIFFFLFGGPLLSIPRVLVLDFKPLGPSETWVEKSLRNGVASFIQKYLDSAIVTESELKQPLAGRVGVNSADPVNQGLLKKAFAQTEVSFVIHGDYRLFEESSGIKKLRVHLSAYHPELEKAFYAHQFEVPVSHLLFQQLNETAFAISQQVTASRTLFRDFEGEAEIYRAEPSRVPLRLLWSKYSDMAPAISPDGSYIIFQSNRKKKSEFRLYEVSLNSKSGFKIRDINILEGYSFVGQPYLSGSDGTLLFSGVQAEELDVLIDRSIDEFASDKGRIDISKAKKADIFMTRSRGGLWQEPVKLKSPVNTKYSELSPSLSADQRYLYFASNRPGGMGGLDIWRAPFTDGKVGKPENMGPNINSSADEMFPVLHSDNQTFTFSSNRKGGLGSFDIYISKKQLDKFQPAMAGGEVLNTAKNDFLHRIPIGTNSLIVSRGRTGREKVYFENPLPRVLGLDTIALTRLYFFDAESRAPLKATVKVHNRQDPGFRFEAQLAPGMKKSASLKGAIINQYFQKDGYELLLKSPGVYEVEVTSEGYKPLKRTVDFEERGPGETQVNIYLSRADEHPPIDLKTVPHKPVLDQLKPVILADLPETERRNIEKKLKPEEEKIAAVEPKKEEETIDKKVTEKKEIVKEKKPRFRSSTVYFKTQSITLLPAYQRELSRLKIKKGARVIVTGHCDSRGPKWYNKLLSKKRAMAVVNFLKKKSPGARYQVRALGETRPKGSNKTLRGRHYNRRVVVRVYH